MTLRRQRLFPVVFAVDAVYFKLVSTLKLFTSYENYTTDDH